MKTTLEVARSLIGQAQVQGAPPIVTEWIGKWTEQTAANVLAAEPELSGMEINAAALASCGPLLRGVPIDEVILEHCKLQVETVDECCRALTVRWLDIRQSEWSEGTTIATDTELRLVTPGDADYWAAVIKVAE